MKKWLSDLPKINVRRSFIKNEQPVLPKYGSSKTYQLSLSHAEIGSTFGNLKTEGCYSIFKFYFS